MQFAQKIEEISTNKHTDIILALDFPYQDPHSRDGLLAKAQTILDKVHPYICAVKINHHLILPLGTFDGIQTLVNRVHELQLQAIMDCKINDIGNTNQIIAEYYFAAGFDALIANPFIGWEEGLKPIFDVARKLAGGVILLTYMSHKGAAEGYGQTVIDTISGKQMAQYAVFASKALAWGADGVIVGATAPDKIREAKRILGDAVPIYSPGIGAQGGAANEARKAGARYLIVGREIVQAENPAGTARKLVRV